MKDMFNSKIKAIAGTIVLSACCLTSCIDPEGIFGLGGEPDLPEGIKPTEEMTYGNLQPEKYAAVAAKYDISDPKSPYESVELFGDGTYLISKKGAGQHTQRGRATVKFSTKEGMMLRIPKYDSKAGRAANEDYFVQGGYSVTEKGHYELENFGSLNVDEVDNNHYNLEFTNEASGRVSTVYADKSEVLIDNATESLCRTWSVNNWEQWCYLNSLLIIHDKYVGTGQPHYEGTTAEEAPEYEQEQHLQQECEKVVFSKSGTYICYFRNGTYDIRTWQWGNAERGVIYYDWNIPQNEHEEGYATFRFKGKQARLYEDYKIGKEDIKDQMDPEDIEDLEDLGNFESFRLLRVTTFDAEN